MNPDHWIAWGADDPEGIPAVILVVLGVFAGVGVLLWLLRGRTIREAVYGLDDEEGVVLVPQPLSPEDAALASMIEGQALPTEPLTEPERGPTVGP